MKIFITEIELKKKFDKKDLFIHFTTKNRANRIINDKTLKATPEGITNFGPSKIYAVSAKYGKYVPKVQVAHLKKLKEKDDSDIIAILFSTHIKPQATFVEETFWQENEIPIKIHKIISINQAQNIINKNNKEKIKDDQDYIIYEGKRDVFEIPKYIYHQTDIENAKEILKHGFEYGGILGKGEYTFGIYFAPTYLGMENVNYNRGTSGKNIMVQVKTDGLNLFDVDNLKNDPNLPSYKQPRYIMMQNIETKGVFPKGHDGVFSRDEYNKNRISEIVLTKEAANKNITGKLINARGRIVN